MVPRAAFDAAALAAGVPASSMQEQLLRSELDPLMYMEVLLMERLRGPLDMDAMVGAWEALVMHQPALRTRFLDEGDRMLQARWLPLRHLPALLHPSLSVQLLLLDCCNTSLSECSTVAAYRCCLRWRQRQQTRGVCMS